MKVSTKGRYALRMLVDLAEHGGGFPVPDHSKGGVSPLVFFDVRRCPVVLFTETEEYLPAAQAQPVGEADGPMDADG